MRMLVLALLASATLTVSAQNAADYHQYLVPLTYLSQPGANGSLWRTELLLNSNLSPSFRLLGRVCLNDFTLQPPCPDDDVVDGNFTHTVYAHPLVGRDGSFIYVPKSVDGQVAMQLRARDTSREAEGLGTEIPVVPVEQFSNTEIDLLNVPNDPRYRVTLRIYAHDEQRKQVRMVVYSIPNNDQLDARMVDLVGESEGGGPFPLSPAYAQIDPISDAVRASGSSRVRVVLQSPAMFLLIDPPRDWFFPIWAFASVTNNQTQQVTTITPHVR